MRLSLNTPAEVRRSLVRVTNMVVNGKMDVKTANCVTATCNVILSSIRQDEDEKRLDELEERLDEAEGFGK